MLYLNAPFFFNNMLTLKKFTKMCDDEMMISIVYLLKQPECMLMALIHQKIIV